MISITPPDSLPTSSQSILNELGLRFSLHGKFLAAIKLRSVAMIFRAREVISITFHSIVAVVFFCFCFFSTAVLPEGKFKIFKLQYWFSPCPLCTEISPDFLNIACIISEMKLLRYSMCLLF